MVRLVIGFFSALILFSCSEENNLFGGYDDPRYFDNIGLSKNPLRENISSNIDDSNINDLFLENDLAKIFILGYYRCPQMCNSFREVLFPQLIDSNLILGEDYEIVMLSINPEESYVDARKDSDKYFSRFFKGDLKRKYLNFMIVQNESVKNIAEKLGFEYRYDNETGEYYHPTVAYVLLSDGRVSNVIGFGENAEAIEKKVDLANADYILNSEEFQPEYFTCMTKDIKNKNPKKAFHLAQFGGVWFVSCSIFCLGYGFLSRRERKNKK